MCVCVASEMQSLWHRGSEDTGETSSSHTHSSCHLCISQCPTWALTVSKVWTRPAWIHLPPIQTVQFTETLSEHTKWRQQQSVSEPVQYDSSYNHVSWSVLQGWIQFYWYQCHYWFAYHSNSLLIPSSLINFPFLCKKREKIFWPGANRWVCASSCKTNKTREY